MRSFLVGAVLAGCTTQGASSNVQLDLSARVPIEDGTGTSHFTIYAIASGDTTSLFAVAAFEVHHVVDLGSPCYIDVGEHVPHPGLHVSQYATVIEQDVGIPDPLNPPPGASPADEELAATALQRERDVQALSVGMFAVTSASDASYPTVDADCTGSGIPPSTCTDEPSNARRLAQCQAIWAANPALYEGTDRILTAPLAGTSFGMVDGMNPVNLAPVGGAEIFSDAVLDGFDSYAIYQQTDGAAGTGTLLLFGAATEPTRGVIHVHMDSPSTAGLTADLAIFPDLNEDDTQF